jgi:two-component system phosphate regulon sensor histidine kinase PhoR
MQSTEPTIDYGTFFRAVAVLSSPALVVLCVLVTFVGMDIAFFLLSCLAVVVLMGLLVWPILQNLTALTHYVRDIAEDNRISAPNLGVLNLARDLSASLVQLHRNWQEKKHQMESVITEREILVDSLPDMLIIINDAQEILRTNKASRLIFGQNLAGKHLKTVLPSDVLLNAVSAVIDDAKGRDLDFHQETPEPRELRAIIDRFPVVSKGGISVIITMSDITELRRIQKMRADFVANASHEIRTPLTSISGLIETIQGAAKDDPEAQLKFIGMIGQQAERMKNLITDLLSLSKIEMNAHHIPTSEVDIGNIIVSEREHFEWAAKNKHMEIRLDFHSHLPLVRGEENELRQVMHNLIGNAIKYGYEETEVIVTARVTSDLPRDPNFIKLKRCMVVTVTDFGDGIAKEHIPRLTERFYRVDSSRTRKIGGTGLGLAIVKHIINRHRGALLIESVVGKGSSFHVYLPLSEDTQ